MKNGQTFDGQRRLASITVFAPESLFYVGTDGNVYGMGYAGGHRATAHVNDDWCYGRGDIFPCWGIQWRIEEVRNLGAGIHALELTEV